MKPEHIAIILDGNRRYARSRGLSPWKGHEKGAKTVEKLVDWSIELGIKELTLYCFSTENFNRDKKEIDHIMRLFTKGFDKINKDDSLNRKGVKVRFVGELDMMPKKIQEYAKRLMASTIKNNKLVVNFAWAYGSRMEIVEAVKKIARDAKKGKIDPDKINEDVFESCLFLKNSPDLLIRPGGEKRLSNFLLWQLAYSELYFLDKLWPEFTREDLKKAIEEVEQRERRFGR